MAGPEQISNEFEYQYQAALLYHFGRDRFGTAVLSEFQLVLSGESSKSVDQYKKNNPTKFNALGKKDIKADKDLLGKILQEISAGTIQSGDYKEFVTKQKDGTYTCTIWPKYDTNSIQLTIKKNTSETGFTITIKDSGANRFQETASVGQGPPPVGNTFQEEIIFKIKPNPSGTYIPGKDKPYPLESQQEIPQNIADQLLTAAERKSFENTIEDLKKTKFPPRPIQTRCFTGIGVLFKTGIKKILGPLGPSTGKTSIMAVLTAIQLQANAAARSHFPGTDTRLVLYILPTKNLVNELLDGILTNFTSGAFSYSDERKKIIKKQELSKLNAEGKIQPPEEPLYACTIDDLKKIFIRFKLSVKDKIPLDERLKITDADQIFINSTDDMKPLSEMEPLSKAEFNLYVNKFAKISDEADVYEQKEYKDTFSFLMGSFNVDGTANKDTNGNGHLFFATTGTPKELQNSMASCASFSAHDGFELGLFREAETPIVASDDPVLAAVVERMFGISNQGTDEQPNFKRNTFAKGVQYIEQSDTKSIDQYQELMDSILSMDLSNPKNKKIKDAIMTQIKISTEEHHRCFVRKIKTIQADESLSAEGKEKEKEKILSEESKSLENVFGKKLSEAITPIIKKHKERESIDFDALLRTDQCSEQIRRALTYTNARRKKLVENLPENSSQEDKWKVSEQLAALDEIDCYFLNQIIKSREKTPNDQDVIFAKKYILKFWDEYQDGSNVFAKKDFLEEIMPEITGIASDEAVRCCGRAIAATALSFLQAGKVDDAIVADYTKEFLNDNFNINVKSLQGIYKRYPDFMLSTSAEHQMRADLFKNPALACLNDSQKTAYITQIIFQSKGILEAIKSNPDIKNKLDSLSAIEFALNTSNITQETQDLLKSEKSQIEQRIKNIIKEIEKEQTTETRKKFHIELKKHLADIGFKRTHLLNETKKESSDTAFGLLKLGLVGTLTTNQAFAPGFSYKDILFVGFIFNHSDHLFDLDILIQAAARNIRDTAGKAVTSTHFSFDAIKDISKALKENTGTFSEFLNRLSGAALQNPAVFALLSQMAEIVGKSTLEQLQSQSTSSSTISDSGHSGSDHSTNEPHSFLKWLSNVFPHHNAAPKIHHRADYPYETLQAVYQAPNVMDATITNQIYLIIRAEMNLYELFQTTMGAHPQNEKNIRNITEICSKTDLDRKKFFKQLTPEQKALFSEQVKITCGDRNCTECFLKEFLGCLSQEQTLVLTDPDLAFSTDSDTEDHPLLPPSAQPIISSNVSPPLQASRDPETPAQSTTGPESTSSSV